MLNFPVDAFDQYVVHWPCDKSLRLRLADGIVKKKKKKREKKKEGKRKRPLWHSVGVSDWLHTLSSSATTSTHNSFSFKVCPKQHTWELQSSNQRRPTPPSSRVYSSLFITYRDEWYNVIVVGMCLYTRWTKSKKKKKEKKNREKSQRRRGPCNDQTSGSSISIHFCRGRSGRRKQETISPSIHLLMSLRYTIVSLFQSLFFRSVIRSARPRK